MNRQQKADRKRTERVNRARARESARLRARAGRSTTHEAKAPPAVQDVVRKQLARFQERWGRFPEAGEPLFFDDAADAPAPMPGDDETVSRAAERLGADAALVGVLVRSGVVVRSHTKGG